MAEEPICERIMQDCEATLRTIDGLGAYHHALLSVNHGRAVPDDLVNLPAAFLEEGDEVIIQDTNLLVLRLLPVTVEAWLRSAEGDLPTQVNRLLADIERALLADPTRGGLAVRTLATGNSRVKDETPGILASARVQFEVEYHTLRADPANKG